MRKTIFTSLIRSCRHAGLRRRIRSRLAGGVGAAAGIAVLAGGLSFVGPAQEAGAIELVANGGFESNDGFNGDNLGFNWDNADGPPNFDVYSHSTQIYYEGAALPAAGDWYFHKVGVPGNTTTQSIDLTSSFATSAIDAGTLRFDYSGYLSGFTPQQDHATLELTFLDGSGTQIGGAAASMDGGAPLASDGLSIDFDDPGSFVEFADPSLSPTVVANFPANPTAAWKLYRDVGGIPVGARTAVVSILENGNDSYVDEVSFDVVDTGQKQFLEIEVDKSTGAITMINSSPDSRDVNFYEITSASGQLSNSWNSFSNQNIDPVDGPDADSIVGNSGGETWDEGGGSNNQRLTEAFLLGSTNFATGGDSETLAGSYAGGGAGTEDVQFIYGLTDDTLLRGIVSYVSTAVSAGDFDGSGSVGNGDLTLLLDNWGNSVPPTPAGWVNDLPTAPAVGNDELTRLLDNWGNSSGLIAGLHAATAVPEPTSVILIGVGFASALLLHRERQQR